MSSLAPVPRKPQSKISITLHGPRKRERTQERMTTCAYPTSIIQLDWCLAGHASSSFHFGAKGSHNAIYIRGMHAAVYLSGCLTERPSKHNVPRECLAEARITRGHFHTLVTRCRSHTPSRLKAQEQKCAKHQRFCQALQDLAHQLDHMLTPEKEFPLSAQDACARTHAHSSGARMPEKANHHQALGVLANSAPQGQGAPKSGQPAESRHTCHAVIKASESA